VTPRICLGYIPSLPVKISRWRKDKQSLTQYIIAEEVNDDESDNALSFLKSSMFDRLQPCMSQQHLMCLVVFCVS